MLTGRVGRSIGQAEVDILWTMSAMFADASVQFGGGYAANMSFDSAEHGSAQRYYVQALRLAHASGDRALGAKILSDMSKQAQHLGNADQALELATAGYDAGLRGGSPTTAARCAVLQGRAQALRGDAAAAARCRLLAEKTLDVKALEAEPMWIQFFTAVTLTAEAM